MASRARTRPMSCILSQSRRGRWARLGQRTPMAAAPGCMMVWPRSSTCASSGLSRFVCVDNKTITLRHCGRVNSAQSTLLSQLWLSQLCSAKAPSRRSSPGPNSPRNLGMSGTAPACRSACQTPALLQTSTARSIKCGRTSMRVSYRRGTSRMRGEQ